MQQKKEFHHQLHIWYQSHGRKTLPWRNTKDVYHIYLSEVMLQQTQVKTVLERFYFPFLGRFPTLESLAKASQDEVLSAWQGLGYYSRALNLHKAAQITGKSLPKTVDALLVLPGIGQNTAHAIASFAYHQPVAVMEANVKRVLCRIFALKNPLSDELWYYAAELLDTENSYDYNQAMMDIGSMVCTKRAPHCEICPASIICQGKESPESFPQKAQKKSIPIRNKHIIVRHDGEGYFHATPRKIKFLNGMYHFEERDVVAKNIMTKQSSLKMDRHATLAMTKIGRITQNYSHFTLNAEIYTAKTTRKKTNEWYSFAELEKLPMSMAEKKILQLLRHCEECNDEAI